MRRILLATGLLASACAAPSTSLLNDQGNRVHCASSGFGVIGTAVALASYQHCVNIYQERGYRVPGSAPPATPAAPASAEGRIARDPDGRLQLVLPSGWIASAPPAALAIVGLYIRDPVIDATVTVSSINRLDVQDLRTHVTAAQDAMRAKLTDANFTPIVATTMTGRPTLRFEGSGTASGLRLHYTYTAIEGTSLVLKVITWMPESRFAQNQDRIDILMNAITETGNASRS